MVNVQQGTLNLLAPPAAGGEPLSARLPGRLPIGQPVHIAAELDLDDARCRILLGDLEIGSGALRRAALTGVRFMTTPPATGTVGLDNLRCAWSGTAAATPTSSSTGSPSPTPSAFLPPAAALTRCFCRPPTPKTTCA